MRGCSVMTCMMKEKKPSGFVFPPLFDVPSLRDARVPDDVVQSDVAARLHAVGGEEEGRARHVLHGVSPLVQEEPLRAEAALVAEQESKSCVCVCVQRRDWMIRTSED